MTRNLSDWTLLRLTLGLRIRVWLNSAFAGFATATRSRQEILADRQHQTAVSRQPIPRKRLKTGLLLVFMFSVLLFSSFNTGEKFLSSLSLELALQPATNHKLSLLQQQAGSNLSSFGLDASIIIFHDPIITTLPPAKRAQAAVSISRRWVNNGGSTSEATTFSLPDVSLAYPIQYERLVTFSSLAVLLALIAAIAINLGWIAKDIGHSDAEALWLISLPIPTRILFAAQIIQNSLLDTFFWLSISPFMVLCASIAHHGWNSIPLAIGVCVPLALALTSIRLAIETAVRQNLTYSRRKDVQIVCSFIGILLMYYLMASSFKGKGATLLGSDLLPWADLPFAWPLRAVLAQGMDFLPWLIASTIFATMVAIASISYAVLAVQAGFISSVETMQGARTTKATPKLLYQWRPLALISKDLYMMRRDRAFLFNSLAVPILIIGFNLFLIQPQETISTIFGSFRNSCALAYFVATYVLIPSATTVLSAEGQALWLLTAAPHPLLRLLQQKLMLWTGLALLYTCVAFIAIMVLTPWPGNSGIADIIMVLLGVPIFAVIAAGIGAASNDPNASNPQQRVNSDSQMILLLIAVMHTQAIYTTEVHTRLLWIMLSGVLAYALWQRLEERLPWLLDPIESPPQRIDLANGAFAAMAFMIIQSFIAFTLFLYEVPTALAILIAFSSAGAITALSALWMFWRNGLADIPYSTGLLPRSDWHSAFTTNLSLGIGGGILAAVIGSSYIYVMSYFPVIMHDIASTKTLHLSIGILFSLTVLAAPLAEEFIFRGLLFKGLNATLPTRWAVPASAATFALLHPSFAVIPVFAMGCIAAIVYRKSGWLLAPVLVHAIYNYVVVIFLL